MIPVATGLTAALWSRLVKESFVLVPLVTLCYSGILIIALLAMGFQWPKSAGLRVAPLIVYAGTSIFIVYAWMVVAKAENGETDANPIALAEMTWPVFTALFMYLLYGVWSLTWPQMLGASLSLVGLLIVALSS